MFGSFSKMNKKNFFSPILISKFQKKKEKERERGPQSSAYGLSQCLPQVLLDMDIETRSNQE